jgi:hypothetical protein
MREIGERVRREVKQTMVDAARADGVSLEADAVALALSSELLVVNMPVAGLEEIDVASMLAGRLVLDGAPIMYWHIAGEALEDKAFPLREGFYTVVADQQDGTVGLRDAKGQTLARGNLDVCISPQASVSRALASVSGDIDKFDVKINKKGGHIEVCGHASASVGSAEVKIDGCVTVDWKN